MKFTSIWFAAILAFSVPGYATEKGLLDKAYEVALSAAEKILGPEDRPHVVDKTKKPLLIIKGSEIKFNGMPLKMGDSLSNWERVLGKHTRYSEPIYIWDSLGIIAYLQSNGAEPGYANKIEEMVVYLNSKPKDSYLDGITALPDGTPTKPPYDFTPKKTFTGYLEIDGAGVDRTSKIWEVNWNKNMFDDPVKHGFQRAHLRTIFRAVSPPPDYALDMSFRTDQKGRDGMIYNLSIGGK